MKRQLLIAAGLLLVATVLLSFESFTNDDHKTMKNDYEAQWKQFEKHLSNSLPESAEKVLNEIEQKAVKEHMDRDPSRRVHPRTEDNGS